MNEDSAPPPLDPRQPKDFEPVALAKSLLRRIRAATLATLREDGAPFASLTAIATECDGAPILLMSRLAAHTRNLERDPRFSLLLAQGGGGDPLTHPRLTLVGVAKRQAEPALRERYLRRNPKAALYADFPDFSFWRAEPTSVHVNGGFARAADFDWAALATKLDGAETLLAAEAEALEHLNAAHAGALERIAQRNGGGARKNWRASGVDPEGLDLLSGDATVRVAFPVRLTTPATLREHLVALARES